MIITFTVVRLLLATVGIPPTRIRLFQAPIPAESSAPLLDPVTSGNKYPNSVADGPDRDDASETSRT